MIVAVAINATLTTKLITQNIFPGPNKKFILSYLPLTLSAK